jgi:hypothetical protein
VSSLSKELAALKQTAAAGAAAGAAGGGGSDVAHLRSQLQRKEELCEQVG